MKTTRVQKRLPVPGMWRKQSLFISLLSATLLLINTPSYADLILNDGGVHNINYAVGYTALLSVYNNVNAPFDPTVVNIYDGADINDLHVYGSSVANIYGGGSFLHSVDLFGGKINIYNVNFTGDALSSLMGGTLKMYGSGSYLDTLWITGGSFFMKDGAITNFAMGGGEAIITGGSDMMEFIIHNGKVKMYGGTFDGFFLASGHSSVTFFGKNFNLPFGTYTASSFPQEVKEISGIWKDGTTFGFTSDYLFLYDSATLNLRRVPEPSTMVLLGSGLVGLIGLGRKRMKM